jgi:hypothetical protein
MTADPIICLVCERVVPDGELARSHRPRYFDDVVICPDCVEGERHGYGENATAVRRDLAARRGGGRPDA